MLDALIFKIRLISIRTRLICALVILSAAPLTVSEYISFVESGSAFENTARKFSTGILKQISRNIQQRMLQIEINAQTLVLSDRVQSTLEQHIDKEASERFEALSAMPGILLDTYGSIEYITQMYFLNSGGQILDSQTFPGLTRDIESFVKRSEQVQGQSYWGAIHFPTGQVGIGMVRKIYLKNNNRMAGSLYLGIKPSYFSEIFDDVATDSGDYIFLMDSDDGEIIIKSKIRSADLDDIIPNHELIKSVMDAGRTGKVTNVITYRGEYRNNATLHSNKKLLAVFSRIPNTAWYVISVIPYDSLLASARSVRNIIMLVGACVLVFAILLSYITWRSISDPLIKLMRLIESVEQGSMPEQAALGGNDELSILAKKFHELSVKVSSEHELLENRVAERTLALEKANQLLAELSATDSLTGIANRRRFDEKLQQEWRRAARLGQSMALAMIDIDWFKKFNDHYGHQAGDDCLRRFATLLKLCVMRPGDLVARYGGEEFAFIATAIDGQNALRIAQSICDALYSLALPHATAEIGILTASIGVAAMVATDSSSPDALLHAADHALYQAKDRGRNRAILFDVSSTQIDQSGHASD